MRFQQPMNPDIPRKVLHTNQSITEHKFTALAERRTPRVDYGWFCEAANHAPRTALIVLSSHQSEQLRPGSFCSEQVADYCADTWQMPRTSVWEGTWTLFAFFLVWLSSQVFYLLHMWPVSFCLDILCQRMFLDSELLDILSHSGLPTRQRRNKIASSSLLPLQFLNFLLHFTLLLWGVFWEWECVCTSICSHQQKCNNVWLEQNIELLRNDAKQARNDLKKALAQAQKPTKKSAKATIYLRTNSAFWFQRPRQMALLNFAASFHFVGFRQRASSQW